MSLWESKESKGTISLMDLFDKKGKVQKTLCMTWKVNSIGGTVSHYRDNTGLECDAVLHLEDGRWGAIEIKLGGDDLIEYGANSLKTLQNKIIEKSEEQALHF